MPEVTPAKRVSRALAWVFAGLPLLYFVVFCTMAADARSGLGIEDSGGTLSLWGLWVKRLSAHIGQATFIPPTLWALTAPFAEQPKGRLVTQAVLVIGGCAILVFSWSMAAQILEK